MSNTWCDILGIEVPRLELVKNHREAKPYTMLIVTLLEHGAPMTLAEVAACFERAGVASAERALLSLKRCRPGRAPVYRDGDRYSLDPHDSQADLWAFRLSLRPPKIQTLKVVKPAPKPVPGLDTALTIEELDEAWTDATLRSWSAQRLTLAVLDVHDRPLEPQAVVDFVSKRTRWHSLDADPVKFQRKNAAVEIVRGGRWGIADRGKDALVATRTAIRQRIEASRRSNAERPDPAVMKANRKAAERRRAVHSAELAKMRRAILYAHPAKSAAALAIIDIGEHRLSTFLDHEIREGVERLAEFDLIGAVDVRALLRTLGFDPGKRRLAELGPPQKTKKLNQRGRKLKITTELLIRGTCGISRPFGDPKKLATYLREGQHTKLRRRLEANVKSLLALYEYGRLHHNLRLRWGFIDERLPAPWVDWDEIGLTDMKRIALEQSTALDVVVGSAPGWTDPWSRAQLARPVETQYAWRTLLIDDQGQIIDEAEIQRARLSSSK